MLRQERYEDPEDALRLALLGWQSELWTSLPGIVESVDFDKNTCTVQPAIKGIFRLKDGTEKVVTLPLCLDVPIHWPTGGGFTLTFPLKKGDEGQLHFNARCIDGWWQNGGVQAQAERRFHDLSDACFYPGIRSQANLLADVATNATELRSDDGTVKLSVKADQIDVAVGNDTRATFTKTAITLNTQPNVEVALTSTQVLMRSDAFTYILVKAGEIDLNAGVIKINNIDLVTHEHTGVTVGGAKTGGPTGP